MMSKVGSGARTIFQPWHANIGKRVVRSPKVYLRDSGIFHSLMNTDNQEQLYSHPKLGASWEGFALECVCRFEDLGHFLFNILINNNGPAGVALDLADAGVSFFH